jgi:hypothetical protein
MGSETYRAAFGGPLASRELWVGRSCSSRCFPSLWGLVTRVRGRIPFGASCPQRSVAREASTLSLVTCHAGFSRHGIDPVGKTSKRPRYPSWRASPCGFTTRIYELDTSMLVD